MALVNGQVTPLWPPTGIALFCLFIFGYRIWPAIAIGALAINAPLGPNAIGVASIVAGNTLAPVVAYALLRRFGFLTNIARSRDAIALACCALIGAFVSSTSGTVAVALTNAAIPFWSTWSVWWTGDAMGMLVVTPFLFVLMNLRTMQEVLKTRLIEASSLIGLTVITALAAFSSTNALIFLVFPLLIWAAWRFEISGAAPTVFIATVVAAIAAGQDFGPFAGKGLFGQMLTLQTFNFAVALTGFFLAAITTERNTDRYALESVGTALERRVEARTEELSETIKQVKQREAALNEAQEVARVGSWEWWPETDEVVWSEMMYRLWGLEPYDKAMNVKWCEDHSYPEDRVTMALAVKGASDPTKPFSYDHRVVWPDGSIHWLFAQGRADVDKTGKVIRVLGTALDIDERKRTENELLKANQEAEDANQAKSQFLSRMSHELRTPLNAIVGFSSLLSFEELSPRHREMVELIEHGGEHLLEIINDVLDISKIEAGQLRLSMEAVPLHDLVSEAIDLITMLSKDLDVSVHAQIDQNLTVEADRSRLRQVLVNLLSNAVKYNRLGGSVTVGTQTGAERVLIYVSDTGHGFPLSLAHEVFTPFSRLGAENSAVEGTGLGLAVSKAIVEEMGGTLKVESTGPSGSIFVIELKAAKPAERPAELTDK